IPPPCRNSAPITNPHPLLTQPCQCLAQDGTHMVLSSRKQSNVDRAMAELQAQNLSISGTVCHVGQAEDREHLVAMALEHHGGIDILVSNAAVNPFIGNIFDATEEVWNKVVVRQSEKGGGVTRRLGLPSVCGGVVSFLCSPNASYITGETVAVGGGAPSRL
uniref:Dehydrogenase/reductase SDR family member 4 n=1 Tax=Pelusios castaneus TaxID=367368 RepID=A0A8C8RW82_9SAUR